MDNRKLEQRIATLEQQLESLEGRYVAHLRSDGLRIVELEIKVQGLEARLKDFDKVESLFSTPIFLTIRKPRKRSSKSTAPSIWPRRPSLANLPTVKDTKT